MRRGEQPLVFSVVRGDADAGGAPAAEYVVELPKARQLVALAALLATAPGRTLRALRDPALRFGGSARDMAALTPMALKARGARHIHAHFAGQPADVAGRLSALTGVPFSFTAHAHDLYVEWDRVEEKLAAASFATTVCEYARRFVAERDPAGARKLEVVDAGIDVQAFARSKPYDPDGPIVAVGRLVHQKGHADLIRAAAGGDLPEVVIVGDGHLRTELGALVEETGANVRLAGALPNHAVRDLYEGASMAALACVVAPDGNRDSIPVTLKEAMALELPVVSTDEVGIPELVGADRGVLAPPGDPQAFRTALRE
ncbi:MAG: glycosyltransferase, partial [Thermoleophilaceae bacterium]|nr:glycosyltransferase [Thermoleophilaceae bacterium]